MVPRRDGRLNRACIAGGILGVLLAVCAAELTTACNGGDACGCLCPGPVDGEIVAPCSAGVLDSDAANSDAPPE